MNTILDLGIESVSICHILIKFENVLNFGNLHIHNLNKLERKIKPKTLSHEL